MSVHAGDFLSADSTPFVKFSLASRVTEDKAFATITFDADGQQKLAQGGYVSVNGIALQAAPLGKFGFWYRAQVPKSSKYILKYVIAMGRPVVQHVFIDRPFVPKIPSIVARGKGVVMEFSGITLMPGEKIYSDIGDSSEGPGRWSETLHAIADGNKLTIPAAQFANVRLGQSQLYVGVILRGEVSSVRFRYLQGTGDERTVIVTD